MSARRGPHRAHSLGMPYGSPVSSASPYGNMVAKAPSVHSGNSGSTGQMASLGAASHPNGSANGNAVPAGQGQPLMMGQEVQSPPQDYAYRARALYACEDEHDAFFGLFRRRSLILSGFVRI
jgi:hypothetical protein